MHSRPPAPPNVRSLPRAGGMICTATVSYSLHKASSLHNSRGQSYQCGIMTKTYSRYEFRNNNPMAYHMHMLGLIELVKLRGISQVIDADSQRLFGSLRDKIICWAILASVDLPFDRLRHSWFFSSLERSPWARLQEIVWRLPGIRKRSKVLFEAHTPPFGATQLVLDDTGKLLNLLRRWKMSQPRFTDNITSARISNETDSSRSMIWRWALACEIMCIE